MKEQKKSTAIVLRTTEKQTVRIIFSIINAVKCFVEQILFFAFCQNSMVNFVLICFVAKFSIFVSTAFSSSNIFYYTSELRQLYFANCVTLENKEVINISCTFQIGTVRAHIQIILDKQKSLSLLCCTITTATVQHHLYSQGNCLWCAGVGQNTNCA